MRAQPAQGVDRGVASLQHGFGEFDFDAAGRQAMLLQQLDQAFHEAWIRKLARHHVDCHARFRPRAMMPVGGGCHRRLQDPVADLHDQTGFLGDRQKPTRRGEAAVGHAPANQRLDQGGLERLGMHFGLEGEFEFAAHDGATQPLLGQELCGSGLEQFRRENRQLAAAERLGAKQRGVCGLEQRLRFPLVIGIDAGAHAHAHDQIAAVDVQRALEGLDDADAGRADRLRGRTVREDHGELIAAQARREPEGLGPWCAADWRG